MRYTEGKNYLEEPERAQTTLPETNSSSLKIGLPKWKVIFQPSIFRCYVSFREGTCNLKASKPSGMFFCWQGRIALDDLGHGGQIPSVLERWKNRDYPELIYRFLHSLQLT